VLDPCDGSRRSHAKRLVEQQDAVDVGRHQPLSSAAPNLAEASIGHELTADALLMGWTEAIACYIAALAPEAPPAI
jgi:hypothetical protein